MAVKWGSYLKPCHRETKMLLDIVDSERKWQIMSLNCVLSETYSGTLFRGGGFNGSLELKTNGHQPLSVHF